MYQIPHRIMKISCNSKSGNLTVFVVHKGTFKLNILNNYKPLLTATVNGIICLYLYSVNINSD